MNVKKEHIKKLIQKEITYVREDTFVNHVKSWWNGDGELSGVISTNSFKIWSCKWSQSGLMHVVVKGEFIETNDTLKIILKTRVNIAGKIFLFSFVTFWGIAIFGLLGNEFILLRCLLFFVFPVLFLIGYNSERKIILETVEKIIASH